MHVCVFVCEREIVRAYAITALLSRERVVHWLLEGYSGTLQTYACVSTSLCSLMWDEHVSPAWICACASVDLCVGKQLLGTL
jgi:hypothetical protein